MIFFLPTYIAYKLKLGIWNGGLCREVVIVQSWPIGQVWLYSQTCVQQTPLGPEKSGGLNEVPDKI